MKLRLRTRQLSALCVILAGFRTQSVKEHKPPQLLSVTPNTGVTTPGSRVSLHGVGFSPDVVVYFGGFQVRETRFVSPSTLELVTPYLRPGRYRLELRSGEDSVQSDFNYAALPSEVDTEIDRATALARDGQPSAAIAILTDIARSHADYQVRAFAHYQMGQIYLAQGDPWRWAGEAAGVYDDADKSGKAVQSYWEYRLSYAESVYLLTAHPDPNAPLRLADWAVKYDVTQNPEPRFFRGLINARYGNLSEAKADSDFILKLEPDNPSYRVLAAYIAVLAGDVTQLHSLRDETIKDSRALSLLGEAAYISGDPVEARHLWIASAEGHAVGAVLAYCAGKKHLTLGHQRVAEALLTECLTMAPDSNQAKEAKDLLAKRPSS